MASSFETLIAERKYPFLFALFVLLLCVSLLLFTNNRFSSLSLSDLERSQQISLKRAKSPPPIIPYAIENRDPRDYPIPVPADLIDWKVCKFAGAVDYIPCLDNWKAIKDLNSRRHMEHRERHCPNPSLRCLVPLPIGYRIPVPWSKSRDMVRLIVW